MELAPTNPADREEGRRTKSVNGDHFYFTAEEETARDAEEATAAAEKADYETNHKYKDDRAAAYGSTEDQLDMIYWDQVNGTTTFKDHIEAIKAAQPKP